MALTGYGDRIINVAVAYAPKVVMALLVLIIGWIVIGWFVGMFIRRSGKRMEKTLVHFLGSIISVSLIIIIMFY